MISVLFFGPVVERTGCARLDVHYTAGGTLQNLRDDLAAKYPGAFEIVCMTAVNGQHIRDMSVPLADGSEVTFMAKFSGG